jgi:hypothetical protein
MQLAKIFSGKKFMWDGRDYDDQQSAAETAQSYRKDGFEVETLEEGGHWYVFSRRVVKETPAGAKPA